MNVGNFTRRRSRGMERGTLSLNPADGGAIRIRLLVHFQASNWTVPSTGAD